MSTTLQNFYKQTISTTCTDSATKIYVSVKPTPGTGWLVISPNNSLLREIIAYSATGTDGGGDYVTVSARGVGGTTAQSHEVNEPIRMNITAQHWADLYVDPTFTGTVTVPAVPSNSTDAASKGYVDGIAIAGSPDASASTKGITKMSVAPVSATAPIAVGDNDTRVPTQDENDALAGTSGTPSTSNKYVTNDDTATAATANKVARRLAGGNITVVTESANNNSTNAASTAYTDTAIAAKVLTYTNGTTTKTGNEASTTQNIAHGLGSIPKKIALTFDSKTTVSSAPHGVARLVYNGTTISCIGHQFSNGAIRDMNSGGSIKLYGVNETVYQTGTVTFDATNIIITWVKTGDSYNFDILWEAER